MYIQSRARSRLLLAPVLVPRHSRYERLQELLLSLAAALRAITETDPPEDRLHYDRLAEHLRRIGQAGHGPRPGDPAPGFTLPDGTGALVSLDTILADGPQIVIFARGAWCPFCVAEMEALRKAEPVLREAGLGAVVITPHILGGADRLRRQTALPYPVLCDVDQGTALAYGCLFALPSDLREELIYDEFDITREYGLDGRFMPIPSCFGVSNDGRIVSAFANTEFRAFPEIDEIVAATRDGLACQEPPTA